MSAFLFYIYFLVHVIEARDTDLAQTFYVNMVNNNQEMLSLMLKANNCDLFDFAVNFIRDINGLESQNLRKVFVIGFLIMLRVKQDGRCNDNILVDFINDKSVILEINLPTEHFRLKVCMYDSTGQEMLVVNELTSFTTEPRNRIVVTAS